MWFYFVLPKHPLFYILPCLNLASRISHIIRKLNIRHNNIYLSSNFQTSETVQILYSNKDSKLLQQDIKKKKDLHKITCHNLWENLTVKDHSFLGCNVKYVGPSVLEEHAAYANVFILCGLQKDFSAMLVPIYKLHDVPSLKTVILTHYSKSFQSQQF